MWWRWGWARPWGSAARGLDVVHCLHLLAQAAVRGHIQLQRYKVARRGVVLLQAVGRMRIARRAYKLALTEAKEQVRDYMVSKTLMF